jgi:nucleoside-diphosphate-sugar epimerase
LAALLPKLGPIFPGRLEAELPVLGSANAADAIWRALERPEASGQVFVVADSPSTSMATLVNELCGVLGRPAPAWALPLACWQAVAALLRLTERIAPGLPLPRASAVSHLHGRLQVRLDRARQVLGYQAATPLAAGLAAQFAAAGGGTR